MQFSRQDYVEKGGYLLENRQFAMVAAQIDGEREAQHHVHYGNDCDEIHAIGVYPRFSTFRAERELFNSRLPERR
jgi:hypothetical protein